MAGGAGAAPCKVTPGMVQVSQANVYSFGDVKVRIDFFGSSASPTGIQAADDSIHGVDFDVKDSAKARFDHVWLSYDACSAFTYAGVENVLACGDEWRGAAEPSTVLKLCGRDIRFTFAITPPPPPQRGFTANLLQLDDVTF